MFQIVKECVEYRLMEENWELKQNKLMKAVVEKMDSMHRKLISNLNVWIKEKVIKENRLPMFGFVSMTCLKYN